MVLWGAIVAFAIRSSAGAEETLQGALDQIENNGIEEYRWIPIFVVGTATVATLAGRWRRAIVMPAATTGLAISALMGATHASFDNNRVTYPTSAGGPASLTELADTSPNGTIASQWATFIAAESIIGGDILVVPAGSADISGAFEIYLTTLSNASVVEEAYDFDVRPDDPIVSGTPTLDRTLNVDWQLTIIGEAERYVIYESPGRIYLVATP